MVNIKLSSAGSSDGSDTPSTSLFPLDDVSKVNLIKTFDTEDPNINLRLIPEKNILCLVLTKREYYASTSEAIQRLMQVRKIEIRFLEFLQTIFN